MVLASGVDQLLEPVSVRRCADRHSVGADCRTLRHQVSVRFGRQLIVNYHKKKK